MDYIFEKVDHSSALQIVAWDYPAPYDLYNLHHSEVARDRLVSGPYFASFSGSDLVGFVCFGKAARLSGKKDNPLYAASEFLDIGLGMHPAWCGKGYGEGFVRAGLLFAQNRGWNEGFRLTVAANNIRARKVYTRLGFREIGQIPWDSSSTWDFLVMTLDTPAPGSRGSTAG
ncbi:MAG: GNAT family N-acetyltransferase [Firmicutes bacterium]|nr:GNAT family N-acetyltransferase [Bacillota bacterium]